MTLQNSEHGGDGQNPLYEEDITDDQNPSHEVNNTGRNQTHVTRQGCRDVCDIRMTVAGVTVLLRTCKTNVYVSTVLARAFNGNNMCLSNFKNVFVYLMVHYCLRNFWYTLFLFFSTILNVPFLFLFLLSNWETF